MRDAINREVLQGAQAFPNVRVIPSDGFFGVMDEWVQVVVTNPGANVADYASLARDGNGNDTMFVGAEPFYVAGAQKFQNQTQCALYLSTAPRRELLSAYQRGGDYPSNGYGMSSLYSSTFSVAIASGFWAYLDENLVWQQALVNTLPSTAYPFGWGAINPANRGRYYSAEFHSVTSAAPTAHFISVVSPIESTIGAIACSINDLTVTGTVRIGDDYMVPTLGLAVGPTSFTNGKVMSREQFTFVIRPAAAVAVTITGELKVIRQGF